MSWSYRDRTHAGHVLVDELAKIDYGSKPLVLAIPNGGVAVALPIAESLEADLDVIIVRKMQIPHNPEAGFGSLTSLGTMILNDALVKHIGLSEDDIKLVRSRTEKQIEERRMAYADLAGVFNPSDRSIILVDDGLASGFTMLAAIQSIRESKPARIMVAVPTSSSSAASRIRAEVDQFICPRVESGFVFAVANAYENWYDAPDDEVIDALARARKQSSFDPPY
ncbi:MAG: phosphoribosyltransferase [Candidatus Thorarchaeota archaeon]